MNCSWRPGTTSMWPWRSTTGRPSPGPTSAMVTGSPRTPSCWAAMSRASSQPLTKPAHSLMPSTVELVRRDRLGDQDPCAVREHLQPALALRIALNLAVRRVQAKLGGDEARDHRRVPGEDADLAHRGPCGELGQLAAEDLALGGED